MCNLNRVSKSKAQTAAQMRAQLQPDVRRQQSEPRLADFCHCLCVCGDGASWLSLSKAKDVIFG